MVWPPFHTGATCLRCSLRSPPAPPSLSRTPAVYLETSGAADKTAPPLYILFDGAFHPLSTVRYQCF